MSYRILLATHCAKYCRRYSIGGRKTKNTTKDPPIIQNNLEVFSASVSVSTVIILSITYFKISGINKGIANLNITIMTVQNIFHLYGATNFIYSLILFMQPYSSFNNSRCHIFTYIMALGNIEYNLHYFLPKTTTWPV